MVRTEFNLDGFQGGALRLTNAVLIYDGKDNAMASVHDVRLVDGRPTIMAGKAMTAAAAMQLALRLIRGRQLQGYLPPELLYAGCDLMMWWLPPGQRHVAFKAQELGERAATTPHPGLVFAGGTGCWRVWAVKGEARPTADTAMFQAPYFNVWSNGGICSGSVNVPDGSCATQIAAWNDAFFGSYFTHPNTGGSGLVKYPGGPYAFWRDMLDGKFTTFPSEVLVDVQCSLCDLIKTLSGEQHA